MLSTKTLLSLVMLVGLGVAIADCQSKSRRPSKFLIQQGYVGWVQIDYGVDGAAPVTIENGAFVFKFPAEGRIKTSSDVEYGWAKDGYYYYSGDTLQELKLGEADRGGMIWAHTTGATKDVKNNSLKNNYERFFVGTEDDYKTANVNWALQRNLRLGL